MRITNSAILLAVMAMTGIVACADDPAVVPEAEETATLAVSPNTAGKWGPFPLEAPVDYGPSKEACAQVVNNEGMFAGWFYANVTPDAEAEAAAMWDRNGKVISTWGTDLLTWVVDVNDRGMILTRAGEPGFHNDPYYVTAMDRSGYRFDLPGGFLVFLTDDPVRMNRSNHVMASYWSYMDEHQLPPVWPPMTYVWTTHLRALTPPADPTRNPPFAPRADCTGEAIDDNGAVYGRCYVEGKLGHYRWVTADNPVPFPSGPDKLRDVRIHDVNRYGELVGESSSGAIFWSPSTGRIEIPRRAGVSRFEPVAINDRGVILVAEFYSEGKSLDSGTIAYWTRAGGTVYIPRIWPIAVVQDMNNQGVIAGCVGGDGPNRMVPAYWKIY